MSTLIRLVSFGAERSVVSLARELRRCVQQRPPDNREGNFPGVVDKYDGSLLKAVIAVLRTLTLIRRRKGRFMAATIQADDRVIGVASASLCDLPISHVTAAGVKSGVYVAAWMLAPSREFMQETQLLHVIMRLGCALLTRTSMAGCRVWTVIYTKNTHLAEELQASGVFGGFVPVGESTVFFEIDGSTALRQLYISRDSIPWVG